MHSYISKKCSLSYTTFLLFICSQRASLEFYFNSKLFRDYLYSIFVSPETEVLISVFYSTLYFLKAGAKVGTFLIPTKCFQVFFMLKNIFFRKYLIL